MSRILVTYFSATGRTQYYSEKIANYLNADLFEIKPLVPYTNKDLDWTDNNSRSSIECNNREITPELASNLNNIFDYDIIFVGFPIWWYREPPIIDSFLTSNFFDGKTIVPFATSGSSQLGKTEEYLKSIVYNADFKQGKLLNHMSDSAIYSWLDQIIK